MALAPLQPEIIEEARTAPVLELAVEPKTTARSPVENLGLLATLATQERSSPREAELHAYFYDGYWQGLRITPPADGADQTRSDTPIIIHSTGFGERIEDSAGAIFHDEMATHFPRVWMKSMALDGLGDTGQQYGNPGEWPRHSLARQAERKAGMLAELAGERPLLFVGTSMGSYKNMRILAHNSLNVLGGFLASPAVVPKKDRWRMAVEFPAKIAWDIGKKVVQSTPDERARLKPKRWPSWREVVAQIGHGLNMLECTTEEAINEMLQKLPVATVVGGEKDAVAMMKHWHQRSERHPHLRVISIPGAGHDFAASPEESARIIADEIRRSNALGEFGADA